MVKEFIATFNLEHNQGEVAEFTLQENNVNATFEIKAGSRDHESLYNREKPDQHPISAITGLAEILESLIENKDKYFVFEQGIPNQTWDIYHNLNKRASVTVVDSQNRIVTPEIIYDDNNINHITVAFNFAFDGKAYLN